MFNLPVSRWRAALFACAGVAILATTDTTFASAPSHTPAYWHPWFEIGGYHNSRENDGVESTGTSGTNRGETTIFAPIRGGQRSLLFGQLTAKFFDDSAKEGNLALGYRRMTTSGFNLGGWIGGDVRRSGIDNTFWQLSGGFEALSDRFDARVNWYGPITKPQAGVAGYAQVQLQDNQINLIGGEEVGMMGVDGEIGYRLPTSFAKLDPNIFELRAYAGGYYFDNSDAGQEIAGVKGRLELRVNDIIASLPGSRLTAEYEISHDDVRDTRHDIGLRVRIPLNGGTPARALASLSGQQRRMLDGIERDTDIVTGRSKAEAVADALTGTDFDRVDYANAANSVTDTSNAAGDNSLIIVNGEVKGEQELQGNQTLQGGGATIQVRGRRTGLVVPFTAPGATGRLTTPGEDNDNLILSDSNIHVAGLVIEGAGKGNGDGHGVELGSNRTNMFLTNLNIQNIGEFGIHVGDDNQVSIIGGVIRSIGSEGIHSDFSNNMSILGVVVSDVDEVGIHVREESTATIKDVTIVDADIGIRLDQSNVASISNAQISDVTSFGIELDVRNQATITGVMISNAGDSAIDIRFENTVTISSLSVRGSARGAFVEERGNVVSINNSSFSDIASDLFLITNDDNELSVTNSVFNNVGGFAFRVDDAEDYDLLVAGNTFNGTIGGLFSFEDRFITDVLAGSTGNTNNTGGALSCQRTGTASFTGEARFVDGTVVNAAAC